MKYPFQQVCLQLAAVFFTAASAFGTTVFAGEVSVAVTSNFDFTADELKTAFENQTGHSVTLHPGPSNRHYGQIMNEAPFDIFLSDDVRRPLVLEQNEMITPGSRFTYALGRLVLWSVDNRSLNPRVLQEKDFHLLSVTNPLLDPFGRAAQEFL